MCGQSTVIHTYVRRERHSQEIRSPSLPARPAARSRALRRASPRCCDSYDARPRTDALSWCNFTLAPCLAMQSVRCAMPPGLSLTWATKRCMRPPAVSPLSITRPSTACRCCRHRELRRPFFLELLQLAVNEAGYGRGPAPPQHNFPAPASARWRAQWTTR